MNETDPDSLRRKPRAVLDFPSIEFPDKERLIEKLIQIHEATLGGAAPGHESVRYAIPECVEAGITSIATNVWKARTKMLDNSGEPREEMKRIYRHVEAIFAALLDMGVEIKDHTGEAFDYGLPLTVVTTQPTPGLPREKVIETIKPTIYWQKQIIQTGEVVIATPA